MLVLLISDTRSIFGHLHLLIQNGDDGGLVIKDKKQRRLIFELCRQKWLKIGIIPLIRCNSIDNDEKSAYFNPNFDMSTFGEFRITFTTTLQY